MPRSRTWPCTVRCSDLPPGIRGRKHKLQMFPLHRGLQRLSAGCRHWQVAIFFPLIGHWSEVCFSHLFFLFASVLRCVVDEVPLTADCLPASVPQILETLEEVPWIRFENLQTEPAFVRTH